MFKINYSKLKIILLLILCCVYFNFEIISTGYFSDDAYNSMVKGWLLNHDQDLLTKLINESKGWLVGSGRLFPGSIFLTFGTFYYIDEILIFKSLTLILICLNLIYFYKNLLLITENNSVSLFSVFLVLIFFQYRQWHDPILGFENLLIVINLLFLSSLYYFNIYLITKDNKYIVLSLLLYVILILMYEVSYPLILIFIFVSFLNNKKLIITLKSLKYHFLSLFTILGITIYYRLKIILNDLKGYPTLSENFSFSELATGFMHQFYSGLSISYLFRTNFKINLSIIFEWIKVYGRLLDILFICIFFISINFFLLNKNILLKKSNLYIKLVLIGILITVPQAMLIALSSHNQSIIQMGYGYGYLPVYIQYFGTALIYSGIIFLLLSKIKAYKFKFITGLIVSVLLVSNLYLNLLQNRHVVFETNKFYRFPRDVITDALKKNILKNLNNDDVIFRSARYPYDNIWFISTYTNKIPCMVDYNLKLNETWAQWPKDCLVKFENINEENLNKKISSNLNSKKYFFYIINPDQEGKGKGNFILLTFKKLSLKSNSLDENKTIIKSIRIFLEEDNKIYSTSFVNKIYLEDLMILDGKIFSNEKEVNKFIKEYK